MSKTSAHHADAVVFEWMGGASNRAGPVRCLVACQSTGLGLAGALFSAPFCVFASGYPLLGGLAWTALIGNIVAACLMHRRRDVAFAALTPFAALCVLLAVLALRGITLAHT